MVGVKEKIHSRRLYEPLFFRRSMTVGKDTAFVFHEKMNR